MKITITESQNSTQVLTVQLGLPKQRIIKVEGRPEKSYVECRTKQELGDMDGKVKILIHD